MRVFRRWQKVRHGRMPKPGEMVVIELSPKVAAACGVQFVVVYYSDRDLEPTWEARDRKWPTSFAIEDAVRWYPLPTP